MNGKQQQQQLRTRSDGSSPSREVQDILGDHEDAGGLGTEIIETEEPYDDDDLVDIEDDDDDDDDDDDGQGSQGQSLMASAAKAALNLTDPLVAARAQEVKVEKAAANLNKSADWPGW